MDLIYQKNDIFLMENKASLLLYNLFIFFFLLLLFAKLVLRHIKNQFIDYSMFVK